MDILCEDVHTSLGSLTISGCMFVRCVHSTRFRLYLIYHYKQFNLYWWRGPTTGADYKSSPNMGLYRSIAHRNTIIVGCWPAKVGNYCKIIVKFIFWTRKRRLDGFLSLVLPRSDDRGRLEIHRKWMVFTDPIHPQVL